MRLLETLQQWDNWLVIHASRTFSHRVLHAWFYAMSRLGDGHAYIFATAYLSWTHSAIAGAIWKIGALAFAINLTIYKLSKQTLKRKRPCSGGVLVIQKIVPPDEFSFPSGHTSGAFVMASLIAHVVPEAAPFVFGWAGMVGFSRVYLGVHYPTDILAGTVLGLSSFKLALWLV